MFNFICRRFRNRPVIVKPNELELMDRLHHSPRPDDDEGEIVEGTHGYCWQSKTKRLTSEDDFDKVVL